MHFFFFEVDNTDRTLSTVSACRYQIQREEYAEEIINTYA